MIGTDAPRPPGDGNTEDEREHDVLDRLDMPPAAAELQASEIHHPDQAPPVAAAGAAMRDDQATEPLGTPVANPVLANFWQALRRLPNYLRLATALAKDPRVPRQAKAMLVVGGVYTVSPIDFVPGVIPVAGQLDDLYVILTALRRAIRSSPDAVAAEHMASAGVHASDLDDDLAAVRALVRQAAATSFRVGKRVTMRVGKQLMSMTSRSLERGRKASDNEPL